MIWDEEEEQFRPIKTGDAISSFLELQEPQSQWDLSGLSEMIEDINNIHSNFFYTYSGYGLIATGIGIMFATRGRGMRPAGIIMGTGMNQLAKVSE